MLDRLQVLAHANVVSSSCRHARACARAPQRFAAESSPAGAVAGDPMLWPLAWAGAALALVGLVEALSPSGDAGGASGGGPRRRLLAVLSSSSSSSSSSWSSSSPPPPPPWPQGDCGGAAGGKVGKAKAGKKGRGSAAAGRASLIGAGTIGGGGGGGGPRFVPSGPLIVCQVRMLRVCLVITVWRDILALKPATRRL